MANYQVSDDVDEILKKSSKSEINQALGLASFADSGSNAVISATTTTLTGGMYVNGTVNAPTLYRHIDTDCLKLSGGDDATDGGANIELYGSKTSPTKRRSNLYIDANEFYVRTVSGNVTLVAKEGHVKIGELGSGGEVDTNSALRVVGLTKVDKITHSADSFMVENAGFTLGATHNGATVIINSRATATTITVPALASGHTTTVINKTAGTVTFVSASGVTLNSLNGATTIAGEHGQARLTVQQTTEDGLSIAYLGGDLS